ncbi:hypothetical protein DFH07DRAFT_927632 [Mycena maculata]|uniref:F-box domain-containing protein n=1 Tax=Mycena maculata TaxID=230809 RepID=A0AAD7MXD2_9AGAR|nr:hypothetical protein DFH07DRAFT_927632 [Mycena maculata]
MPAIERLTLDLLSDMMLTASTTGEKFAISQVSRLWRDVALDTPLLWSSFIAVSKRDYCRVPLILQRIGTTTTLHIRCWSPIGDTTYWAAEALKVLLLYVARIESLEMDLTGTLDVTPLLNSGLQFPSLRTLRLKGPELNPPPLSLSAPQLRTLDIVGFNPRAWDALLVPTLENITLRGTDPEVRTLLGIFTKCPLAWRVVHDRFSEVFVDCEGVTGRRRAALRELELRFPQLTDMPVPGSAYTVLCALADCIAEDDVPVLTRISLPGIGAIDYGPMTIRTIRMKASELDHYAKILGSRSPQCNDSITLAIEIDRMLSEDQVKSRIQVTRIFGLSKVEFLGGYTYMAYEAIQTVLAHIAPPEGRKAEVCIGGSQLESRRWKDTVFGSPFQMALAGVPGNYWELCSHCE